MTHWLVAVTRHLQGWGWEQSGCCGFATRTLSCSHQVASPQQFMHSREPAVVAVGVIAMPKHALLLLVLLASSRASAMDNAKEMPLNPWQYSLPARQLDAGIRGASHDRLLQFVSKLRAGSPVTMALIGGSFSMASPFLWFTVLIKGLQAWFPGVNISSFNSAYGGTTPAFSLLCLGNQLPPGDIDMVMVEFNNNNGHVHADFKDPRTVSYERLLRKLLDWPGQPAVVVPQFTVPDKTYQQHGYHATAEDTANILVEYYQQTSVSMRAAMYHLQHQGTKGFADVELRYDGLHFGELGHRYAADMVMRALQLAANYLVASHPSTLELAPSALPEPMLPGNHPRQTKLCAIKEQMAPLVQSAEGWLYGADDKAKRKSGFVTRRAGANITVAINTTMPGVAEAHHALLYVAYLRSYTHMGAAQVSCGGGCTCREASLQGHWEHKLSLTNMELMNVTQADSCLVTISVLNETLSGGHKFKIFGFIVTEVTPNPDEPNWFFGHEQRRRRLAGR